ncbi:TIGR02281 family clan AA aspartic protease [Hansschlegelia quercus]|nr:TIGR02281 family clan AA aspartic protease [Hansschlegelia quercus]
MIKLAFIAAVLTIGGAWLAGDLARMAAPVNRPAPKPEQQTPGRVVLRADPDGHFRVDATIGGRRAPMLVDTGATVVALSYENGRDLGLISGADRFDLRVSTANGTVGAKRVVLRDLRVGSVQIQDVTAVVLSEGAMDGALLGMSFLGRLRRMETSGDRMVLER